MKSAVVVACGALLLCPLSLRAADDFFTTATHQETGGDVEILAVLDQRLKNLTVDEASDVILSAIERIQKSLVSEEIKGRRICILITALILVSGNDGPARLARVVESLDIGLVRAVVASAIVASGAQSRMYYDAVIQRLGADTGAGRAAREAALEPPAFLCSGAIADSRALLLAARVTIVPGIPSQEPTTAPLTPIPVAGKYPGQ